MTQQTRTPTRRGHPGTPRSKASRHPGQWCAIGKEKTHGPSHAVGAERPNIRLHLVRHPEDVCYFWARDNPPPPPSEGGEIGTLDVPSGVMKLWPLALGPHRWPGVSTRSPMVSCEGKPRHLVASGAGGGGGWDADHRRSQPPTAYGRVPLPEGCERVRSTLQKM